MIRRLATLLLAFWMIVPTQSRADDDVHLLAIQPRVGYQSPRIFTQGQNANYRGMNYGGSVYYRMGGESFALAPFVTYEIGKFDNTANTAIRTEKVDEKNLTLGLKAYFGSLFLRGGYSWVNFKSTATGTQGQTISDSTTGLSGGIGLSWTLSRYIQIELSGEVLNANFSAKTSGFAAKSQYLRFGGVLGIGIILPSAPAKKSTFKFTDIE